MQISYRANHPEWVTHRAYGKQKSDDVESRTRNRGSMIRVREWLIVAEKATFVRFAEQEEHQHGDTHWNNQREKQSHYMYILASHAPCNRITIIISSSAGRRDDARAAVTAANQDWTSRLMNSELTCNPLQLLQQRDGYNIVAP